MPLSVDSVFEALARFVVRFRWFIVAFWILVAIVTSGAFPSLSSEVNNNNSAFLPANAPSQKAATLATPVLGGGANGRISDITVIASRSGPLTGADLQAISREGSLAQGVKSVQSVRLSGISADREAAAIRVRVVLSASDITKDKTIVDNLQGTFARAGAPAGLQFHLAGEVATAVDNQASSNKAGNRVQSFSILFVIVLLLFVFRSVPAAIVTLLPSALSLLISMRLIGGLGQSGLKISSITQVLLIVLLIGAGTDYGLFLVFRVREELRNGLEPHDAVRRAIVRVGESITASAGTVILALLTLLIATFGLYHDLGVPLAVGVAVMLAMGLTLLPALLAILGRRAFWPSKIKAGQQREGAWGRVASRLVQRPELTLAIGLVVFLGLAAVALGYHSSGFGGATNPPSGSDAAAGNAALQKHFPETSNNPANLIFAYPRPVWTDPGQVAVAGASLRGSGKFTQVAGPLNPNGTPLTPSELTRLYTTLGPPQRLPVVEHPGTHVPTALYNAYRSTAVFVSTDGRTIQFEAALRAGAQTTTAAMKATPAPAPALLPAASRVRPPRSTTSRTRRTTT